MNVTRLKAEVLVRSVLAGFVLGTALDMIRDTLRRAVAVDRLIAERAASPGGLDAFLAGYGPAPSPPQPSETEFVPTEQGDPHEDR